MGPTIFRNGIFWWCITVFLVTCQPKKPVQEILETKKPAASQSTAIEKLPLLEQADSLMEAKVTNRAMALYDSAKILYLTQHRWQAYLQAVNKLAAVRISNRDFDGALNILMQGKSHLKDSLAASVPLEIFYTKLGISHFFLNHADSAKYCYQLALAANQNSGDSDLFNAINIYEGFGNIERYSNHDYTEALKYYEKINALLDQMDDSDEKKRVELHCYYNLATTNRVLKNVEKALYYGNEAVRLAEELNEPISLQLARSMLANIYDNQRQYEKSITIFKNIIRTYEDSSLFDLKQDEYSKNQYLSTLLNLGKTYVRANKRSASLEIFHKILIRQHLPSDFQVEVYSAMGYVFKVQEEFNKAIYYYSKTLSIARTLYGEKHQNTAKAYSYLSGVYGYYGIDMNKALKYNQLALCSAIDDFSDADFHSNPTIKPDQSNYFIYSLLIDKSYFLYVKYQSETTKHLSLINLSFETYLIAEKVMHNKRNDDILETDELGLANDEQNSGLVALNDIYILMTLNQSESFLNQVFHLMNRNKARILLKTLNEAEALHDTGVPDSLISKRNDLKQQLTFWQNQMSKQDSDSISLNSVNEKIFNIIEVQNRLNRHIENNYPAYYKSKYRKDTIELKQIEQLSEKRKTFFIQYACFDTLIYALAVWKNEVCFFRTNIDPQFTDAINTYRNILDKPDFFSKSQYSKFKISSYFLFQTLLKPAFASLNISPNDSCDIVIVPDGLLNTIPFESLLVQQNNSQNIDYRNLDYLITYHSVQYSYSAEFLFHRQHMVNKNSIHLGGWGYDLLKNRHVQSVPVRLNATKKELLSLNDNFQSTIFWREKSTETSFKKYLSEFDILHLSVHGIASDNGSNTALFFNQDQKNDGILHPYELYEFHTSADLAVLSACETGVGSYEPGEGIYSIARAFFYVGCPSVIMSLWNVKDQSGQKIMTWFYKNLVTGKNIDQSLRLAKLKFIRESDEITAHPSSWAALVSLGQPNTFVQSDAQIPPKIIYISTGIIILIIGSIYLLKKNTYKRLF